MPATLSAPSATSSQLLFDFDSVSVVAPVPKPVSVSKRVSQPRATHARRQSVTETTSSVVGFVAEDLSSARTSLLATVGVPDAKLPRRGGGEVKLGAVMIKLLKRYGITDAEIEEGLAEYASRRR